MKKFIFFFIFVSLLLSGIALAHDKPIRFADCDKDNKGFLTFEEAHACWPRMTRETFDAIDTNKDGTITRQKLKENRERHAEERRERVN